MFIDQKGRGCNPHNTPLLHAPMLFFQMDCYEESLGDTLKANNFLRINLEENIFRQKLLGRFFEEFRKSFTEILKDEKTRYFSLFLLRELSQRMEL